MVKINSKFIGILYGNYRIIMKWPPLGQAWVIGKPRRHVGRQDPYCTGIVFLRVKAVERVSGALSWPGSSLEERAAVCLSGGHFKGEPRWLAHRQVFWARGSPKASLPGLEKAGESVEDCHYQQSRRVS